MVSMKDIAAKCGVSVATVSKALNDQADIGTATKAYICRTAEEMGYMTNVAARALRTNRTYNVGVLFEDNTKSGLAHEYFSSILESFKRELEESGYDLTFINRSVAGKPSTYLKHCVYRKLDGVAIIAATNFNDYQIEELINSDFPVITLDYMSGRCPAVISDNTRGVETLVRYAYSRGHRKIAFIHGENTEVTFNRMMSFQRAVTQLGLVIPDEYIVEGRYHDIDACKKATMQVLALKDRPTCIIFPDDYSFIGGMRVIGEEGLSIPNDISVMSYDGINMAKVLGITTYYQNSNSLGRIAAKKLIKQIEDPQDEIETTVVSGKILEGNTVKKLDL